MTVNPLSADDWIIVPRWHEFQHYKDRNPLWIKVYARLLHDPKFLDLSPASRGTLLIVWLLYSQESEQVQVKMLQRYGGHGVGFYQLEALNQAGFIRFSASKPLALNEEKEIEIETQTLSEKSAMDRALDLVSAWQGGPSETFDDALDQIERDLQIKLAYSLRVSLWDEASKQEQPA